MLNSREDSWGVHVRSERAWVVLRIFNFDNRFSHLINIISHVEGDIWVIKGQV